MNWAIKGCCVPADTDQSASKNLSNVVVGLHRQGLKVYPRQIMSIRNKIKRCCVAQKMVQVLEGAGLKVLCVTLENNWAHLGWGLSQELGCPLDGRNL